MRKQQSFSLVEFIVSLSILIIIAAIALPKFSISKRYLLQSEVHKLFVTFSFLQQKALASHRIQKLFIDAQSYTYGAGSQRKIVTNLHKNIAFNFLKNAKGPPATPRTLIKKSVTFPPTKGRTIVTFWPDGRITSGTIYLTDNKEKYMTALTCPVAPVSYIRTYNYRNGKWVQS